MTSGVVLGEGAGSGLLDFLTSEGSLYHFFLSYLSLRNSLNCCSSLKFTSLSLEGSHLPAQIMRAIYGREEGGREREEGGRGREEGGRGGEGGRGREELEGEEEREGEEG